MTQTDKVKNQVRKTMLLLVLAAYCRVTLAAGVTTVTLPEMGKARWAFKQQEMMLTCTRDGALFVVDPGTLMQYPLNVIARSKAARGEINAQPVTTIQLDDPQHPGQKMDLQPFITRAERLCHS